MVMVPVCLNAMFVNAVGIRNVPSDVCYDDTKYYQVPSKKQDKCKVNKQNSRRRCVKCKVNLHDICFEIFRGYYV